MKAAQWTAYGTPDVLKVMEIPRPTPKSDELLIRVFASSVSSGDARLRACRVPAGFGPMVRAAFGFRKPRIKVPGLDFSGEVVATGEAVTQFQIGDQVCGVTGMQLGSHAEYLTISEKAALVKKPVNLSHEETAACLFGGHTAIYFLIDKAKLKKGQTLLVNGASGSVGSACVQLAKHVGAHVTGVCSSENLEMVRLLGADETIDYTTASITDSAEKYDAIIDTIGNLNEAQCRPLLAEGGCLILIVGTLLAELKAHFHSDVISGTAAESKDLFSRLVKLMDQDAIKPVIDSTYSLENISDAHRRVDSGHKKGGVVLLMG